VSIWRRFLKGWKAFWHPIGKAQTIVVLSVIYFVILPFFSLVRFKDPLRKRLGLPSYWIRRRPVALDLERQRLPF
jgi:hypothetical protein